MAPTILSISSQVVHGHVGNSAIIPAVQTLGFGVNAIPTVLISNHPAHGSFVGNPISADEIEALMAELAKRGFLKSCAGILSGYLASEEQINAVLIALEYVENETGRAIHYCCDPAMGDSPAFKNEDAAGRLYIDEAIANGIRNRLVPMSNILTPNAFELAWLSGMPVTTVDEAINAAQALGIEELALTSLVTEDRVYSLSISHHGVWAVNMPKVTGGPPGAGDMFAALYLARRVKGQPPHRALALAASSTFAIVRQSALHKSRDLMLIDYLSYCSMPDNIFDAEEVESWRLE